MTERSASVSLHASALTLALTPKHEALPPMQLSVSHYPRRNSRRGSYSQKSSRASMSVYVPLYVAEVASRIDDAAEGTVREWPFDQPMVERRINPTLCESEFRMRYGARLMEFGPRYDISSSSSSSAGSSDGSVGGAERVMSRSPSLAQKRRRKIKSNQQLVAEVRAAKRVRRRRLREEALRNRYTTLVKQWKDRVVDFGSRMVTDDGLGKGRRTAATTTDDSAPFHYDVDLDPVHLHHIAMKSVLDDERQVAEQLMEMFQKMAREADELRKERELQEEQEASAAAAKRIAEGGGRFERTTAERAIAELDTTRALVPRVPFELRIAALLGDDNADPLTLSTLLPRLPASTAVSLTRELPAANWTKVVAGVSEGSPRAITDRQAVERDHLAGAREAAVTTKPRHAPWAAAVERLEQDYGERLNRRSDVEDHSAGVSAVFGSTGVPPKHASTTKAVLLTDAPRVKFAPSSSAIVGPSIKGMVEAANASSVPAAQQVNEGQPISEREDAVSSTASRALGNAEPEVTSLPSDWAEIEVPSNEPLLRELMGRLSAGLDDLGVALLIPPALLCPLSGVVMLQPIIVADRIGGGVAGEHPVLSVTVDRSAWHELAASLLAKRISVAALPEQVRAVAAVLIRGDALILRPNIALAREVIAWRSTALCMLRNRALFRREAFSAASLIVTQLLEGVAAQATLPVMRVDANPSAKLDLQPTKRRLFRVSILSAKSAALDAKAQLLQHSHAAQELRTKAEAILKELSALSTRRGVFDRDLTRVLARMDKAESTEEATGLVGDLHRLTGLLQDCDSTSATVVAAMLDTERAFERCKSQMAKCVDRIELYNSLVPEYNAFTVKSRGYWGPIYKATISACYTVVYLMFERMFSVTAETRAVAQKVIEFLQIDGGLRQLATRLPEYLLQTENMMKRARLPLQPLKLTDAAFVIMSPEASFEDTLPFEPLVTIAYESLSGAPLVMFQDTRVSGGVELLRRRTLVPVAPSPRDARYAAALLSRRDRSPSPEKKFVRPPNCDPSIPFWHFVRRPPTKAEKGMESELWMHSNATVATTTGKQPSGVEPPSRMTPAAPLTTPPHNQFLARMPVHTRRFKPKHSSDGTVSPNIATVYEK